MEAIVGTGEGNQNWEHGKDLAGGQNDSEKSAERSILSARTIHAECGPVNGIMNIVDTPSWPETKENNTKISKFVDVRGTVFPIQAPLGAQELN